MDAIEKPPLVMRAVRRLRILATNPNSRYELWRRIVKRKGSFQAVNMTWMDRYPGIFAFVQETLGTESPVRLLSFGCSTGEEAFTLRRYFPHASIKGIDINAGNIAIARRQLQRQPDDRITFETAGATTAESSESYDAAFCMAVLRHGELAAAGVTRCDHLLPFADFAAAVEDIARCLKPGGLLVIRHSNFRLCDAPVGATFETILSVPTPGGGSPLFGPDNQLMPGAEYPDTVFRKLASA